MTIENKNAALIQIFIFAPCQFQILVVLSILYRIQNGPSYDDDNFLTKKNKITQDLVG